MDPDIASPSRSLTNRKSLYLPSPFQPPLPPIPQIRTHQVGRSVTPVELVSPSSQKVTSYAEVVPDEEVPQINIEDDDLNISSSLIFHSEHYLTYLKSKEEYNQANIQPDEQKYLRYGRPDLPKLFDDIRSLCIKENISRVGVFVCGPSTMINETVDLCRSSKMSGCSAVRFDCHHEVFDF
jgi:hypothetical protein